MEVIHVLSINKTISHTLDLPPDINVIILDIINFLLYLQLNENVNLSIVAHQCQTCYIQNSRCFIIICWSKLEIEDDIHLEK